MSNPSQSGKSILDEAVKEWERAQILFKFPAWEGQPAARHMVELLKDRRDLEANLIALLNHNNQLVVAYALLTLEMMNSSAVRKLPPELLQRDGKITQIMGSFKEKMELKAFARHIQKEWLARNKDMNAGEESLNI